MTMLDRRAFGAALVAGSATIGATTARGADDQPAETDNVAPAKSSLDEASDVELLLALALREVPADKRTPEVIDEIRLDIERNLGLGRIVARYPLENGDAPAPPFRAWRRD